MVYATKADIDDMYGPDLLTDILEDGVDVDAAAASALEIASTEINTHLSVRYSLPLSNSPAALKMPCINIAIYNLANRHTSLTDTMRDRYKDAVELLKRIADGKAGLGADEPAIATGAEASEDGAAFYSHDRLFTRGPY